MGSKVGREPHFKILIQMSRRFVLEAEIAPPILFSCLEGWNCDTALMLLYFGSKPCTVRFMSGVLIAKVCIDAVDGLSMSEHAFHSAIGNNNI
jgi:hypothetical protein